MLTDPDTPSFRGCLTVKRVVPPLYLHCDVVLLVVQRAVMLWVLGAGAEHSESSPRLSHTNRSSHPLAQIQFIDKSLTFIHPHICQVLPPLPFPWCLPVALSLTSSHYLPPSFHQRIQTPAASQLCAETRPLQLAHSCSAMRHRRSDRS